MIREKLHEHQVNTDYLVQNEDFETTVLRTFVAASGDSCSILSGGSMLELPQHAVKMFFAEPLQHAKCVSTEIRHLPLNSVEETLDLAVHSIRFLDLALLPSIAVHDAGLGDWKTLERCIAKSTVVKASVDAARELTNDPAASPEDIARRLHEKYNVPFVALTDNAPDSVDKPFIAVCTFQGLPDNHESAVRLATLAGAIRRTCVENLGALPSEETALRLQQMLPFSTAIKARTQSVDSMPFVKAIDGPNSSLTRDIEALLNLRRLFHNLDYATHFQSFVQRIITSREQRNRVYTSGIGKSGIVAKRFASTLSSLSIPSQWIHGSEWTHGELGNLLPGDVIVLFSNSGKTPELLNLPNVFHEFDCDVMCVVGNDDSPLYHASDYKIFTPAKDCLFDSVPSRSIVAQEAVCNAVAESVVAITGIKRATFKKNHPGGNIGAVAAATTQKTSPSNPQTGK
ncbi:hypothetical protein DYB32_007154 [Aphanomyces invadans]|uniref:SIS domain-containing protein n=1 Tax=Aphanomyces invadans TaxID=157072 RepID=A0A3R6WIF0_9STRA|nr:hypothetical protein DYB32_007154 [Aphanomyces invadans]